MPSEPVYLLNTRTFWDEMPRARHQLARALAAQHKVYFIEFNRIGPAGLSSKLVEPGLTVLTPSFPLDPRIRYRIPALSRRYQRWLFPAISEFLASEGVSDCYVVNFDHTATEIFNYFPFVAYFCNDDPLLQPGLLGKISALSFRKSEGFVLRKSLFTVVVSDYLFRKKNADKKYLLYLGVEPLFLMQPLPHPPNGKVILNHMGFINSRIETKWIVKLAKDFPYWEIELVGKIDRKNTRLLDNKKNIYFLGEKIGEDLCRSLEHCTLGILPYKNNRRMKTCSANNKYWQYLALGKPVIYRKLPDLIKVPEQLLYKASSYKIFREQILRAIREDCIEYRTERREFAKENGWDRRADAVCQYFLKHIPEKRNESQKAPGRTPQRREI